MTRLFDGKTILVVEDDPLVLRALVRTLKLQGAKVVTATSPAQALSTLRVLAVDAVSTDWDLGHRETSEPVIKRAQELGIPVVLVTGDTHPAEMAGLTCTMLLKGRVSSLVDALIASGLTTKAPQA